MQKPKTLKDFTTTKNDAKKGINRLPLEMARLTDEDSAAAISTEFVEGADNYKAQMDTRVKAFITNARRTSRLGV